MQNKWNMLRVQAKWISFSICFLIWFIIKRSANTMLCLHFVYHPQDPRKCYINESFFFWIVLLKWNDCISHTHTQTYTHTHAHIYFLYAAAAAKSLQSCLTLCDPINGSPSGSPVPGILQARTLEWVAISFSNAWKWKVKRKSLSCVRLFVTPWTAAYQAPPSMGFSRQEYWSGVPLPYI